MLRQDGMCRTDGPSTFFLVLVLFIYTSIFTYNSLSYSVEPTVGVEYINAISKIKEVCNGKDILITRSHGLYYNAMRKVRCTRASDLLLMFSCGKALVDFWEDALGSIC
jgi:hypothetical protein